MTIEIDLVFHAIEGPNAVALPAGQAGFRTLQICGIGYRRIRPRCEMNFETAQGITIPLDVLAPLTMAGFAGDPELGHLPIPFVARKKSGLPFRNVAIHARPVPRTCGIIFLDLRRNQKCLGYWRPNFLSDDVTEGKLLEGPTVAGLQPKDLQIVRTGHEHDLLGFTVAAAFWPYADKHLVAATLSFVFVAVVYKLEPTHIRRQTLWRCHLRHSAMKRCMPARV